MQQCAYNRINPALLRHNALHTCKHQELAFFRVYSLLMCLNNLEFVISVSASIAASVQIIASIVASVQIIAMLQHAFLSQFSATHDAIKLHALKHRCFLTTFNNMPHHVAASHTLLRLIFATRMLPPLSRNVTDFTHHTVAPHALPKLTRITLLHHICYHPAAAQR